MTKDEKDIEITNLQFGSAFGRYVPFSRFVGASRREKTSAVIAQD
jgi:hypothetical protein